jgi:hypothetical protein
MSDDIRQAMLATLRDKQRRYWHLEGQSAMFGVNTPPEIAMQAEDLAREIRQLQQQLGLGVDGATPLRGERRSEPRPIRTERYEPLPVPREDFERQVSAAQERERQRDIKHRLEMLSIHRRNLEHYRKQAHAMGAFAPPMVQHGIREAQQGISAAKDALRGYGVAVEDLAGDE